MATEGGVNYILHDLVWEKSALHMKQYIHKTYLGGSRYQFSVCKSCVNHMQNRGEHIVTPGPSYMIHTSLLFFVHHSNS